MKRTRNLLLQTALVILSFTYASGQCTGPCKEYNESPINIITNQTRPCATDPLMTDFPVAASNFQVAYNSGKHNVILTPVGTSTNRVHFHDADYALSEIHAHDTTEHVVNGTRTSYELHFVFSRTHGEGSEKLVIGIRGNYTPSGAVRPVDIITTKLISDIAETGKRKCAGHTQPSTTGLSLNSYQSSGFLKNYITYCGSLTTAPFDKIVTWIVCTSETRAHSPNGINILKSGMCPNTIEGARPLQEDRVPVYRVSNKIAGK